MTAALSGISPGTDSVGALMRSHDWSASPLGAPAGWPQPLRTLVNLVTHSKTPMFLAWGPELCLLYNEPYLDILGTKHPAALGRPLREIWPEVWQDIEPLIERTLSGEANHRENVPFTIRRKGIDEQT